MNNGDKIEVRTEEHIGFDGQRHKVWSIKVPEPVDFSESEACIPPEEYEEYGRYWFRPVNLIDTRDLTIETVSFRSANLYSYRWKYYKIISETTYPLYDINNKIIGYVEGGETHYSNEWLLSNHKYKEYIKRRRNQISTCMAYILWIGFLIYIFFFK